MEPLRLIEKRERSTLTTSIYSFWSTHLLMKVFSQRYFASSQARRPPTQTAEQLTVWRTQQTMKNQPAVVKMVQFRSFVLLNENMPLPMLIISFLWTLQTTAFVQIPPMVNLQRYPNIHINYNSHLTFKVLEINMKNFKLFRNDNLIIFDFISRFVVVADTLNMDGGNVMVWLL